MKLPIFHGKFLTTTYQIRDDLHAYINNSNDLNFYLPTFFVFALCIRIKVPTKNCVKQNSFSFKKGNNSILQRLKATLWGQNLQLSSQRVLCQNFCLVKIIIKTINCS